MPTTNAGETPRLADAAEHRRLPEHDLLNDGKTWRSSMEVTLWKIR